MHVHTAKERQQQYMLTIFRYCCGVACCRIRCLVWGCQALARGRTEQPVNLKKLHHAPFFQNGAKSGFEMCFGPSTLGAGAKTRLESRIKKFARHIVFTGRVPAKDAVTAPRIVPSLHVLKCHALLHRCPFQNGATHGDLICVLHPRTLRSRCWFIKYVLNPEYKTIKPPLPIDA